MPKIEIPMDRAQRHGGKEFYQGGEKFAETFEILGDLNSSHRVLDIGCGPGRMAIGIGNRFNWKNDYLGFDIILVDVEICRSEISNKHPNFRFEHLNVFNGLYNKRGTIEPNLVEFPVNDNSVDFVFATSVFTHMFKIHVERYLKEAHRVMSEGGSFLSSWFIIDHAVEDNIEKGYTRFPFSYESEDGVRYNDTNIPEEQLAFRYDAAIEMFSKAGFKIKGFYRGDWAKVERSPRPRHSQDIFVLEK